MTFIYFIYGLFNDAVSNSVPCVMRYDDSWIGKDMEGNGRDLIWRNIPGICREGLRKITKNLSKDSWSPCRDLNLGPPEYKVRLRLAQPGGPTARVSILPFLPEDGRRSSFRNVILLEYRSSTKSKKSTFTDYNAPLSKPFRFHKVEALITDLRSSVALFKKASFSHVDLKQKGLRQFWQQLISD
jgi:hypothetical protein